MENETAQTTIPDVSLFMAQTYMAEQAAESEQNIQSQENQGPGEIQSVVQSLDDRVTMLSDDFSQIFDTISKTLGTVLDNSKNVLEQVSNLLNDQLEESRTRENDLERKFLLSENEQSNVEVSSDLRKIYNTLEELGLDIVKIPRAKDADGGFLETVKGLPGWVIGTLIAIGVISASEVGMTGSAGNNARLYQGEDKNIDGGTLSELISGGESKGNYDVYNYYKDGKLRANYQGGLQGMTINQILAKQEKKEFHAVGKYQMVYTTLKEGKKILKLSGDEKFDAAMQERLFKDYLISNKPGREDLRDYISGKSDNLEAALNDLSLEFSSVSKVYGRLESQYQDRGDKASISREEAAIALMAEREQYRKNKEANLESANKPPVVGREQDKKVAPVEEARQANMGDQLSQVSKESKNARIAQTKNMVNIVNSGAKQKPPALQNAPHLIPAINVTNSMVT